MVRSRADRKRMIPTSTRLSYTNGYLELGMIEQAREELDAIAKRDALLPEVLAMRAKLHLESRNWEMLEAVSRDLTDRHPESFIGWVHRAYALRELDRTGEAKSVALQGVALHPKSAVLWFNLACYCSLLNEVEDASEHLDKAIALEKSFEAEAVDDPDLQNLWNWIQRDPGA